jgi:peptidylprolyl isomerase domain and WD repeat-containing protein 1
MASPTETTANSTITATTIEGGGGDLESKRFDGAASTTSVGKGQQQQEDDDDETIGPGPAPAKQRQKRPLQFEKAFLNALPSAAM